MHRVLHFSAALLLPLLLAACASGTGPIPSQAAVAQAGSVEDARFQRHSEEFLEAMWKMYPGFGVGVGRYEYASELTVPDAQQRAAELAFIEGQLETLMKFDPATLSASNRVDHELIKNQLEARRWYLTTFRSWQWQPSNYNVANGFGTILNEDYAPLDKRLRDFLKRLEKVPAFYAAAKANIADPTLEHTQLAILQNKGALGLFGPALTQKVDGSGLSTEEKLAFQTRVGAARAAIEDYIAFLTELDAKLQKDGARSFRIGKELYEQKFAHDIQSGYTGQQLYQRALAEKAWLHDEMEKLGREIWPKHMGDAPVPADRLEMIGRLIDKLSERHVKREEFVDAVRAQIPELAAFVNQHDLITQDPSKPLVVRETPEYQRGGGAGASIDSPGPYDAGGNTYYNVTPLDRFTEAQAESYLREYNHWMLQILNIHEAIPGHYTQLVHSNKAKSLIKSIFGNGAMVEGWAVYTERMMLDAGYGGGEPEMRFIWMKWNLRTVVNTILDYQIQTMGMTRDEAITMMRKEAFQQETEATEKWRRATLSQVQLTSYFAGYAEIWDFQQAERKRLGEQFKIKEFNDRFLSYGSAPVRLIKDLMR
jgi:uncharacterized protein (DUF885 family)